MSKRNNDLTEIRIMAKTVNGSIKVDTGAGKGRAVHFATMDAAMAFVEGFDYDKLTVMIGWPMPTSAASRQPR